ncbi:MAG TPA: VWA domain-containing protein, partial [Pyrinomonadaceae bacterium]|nr:VWA domain-containing protein [Pyrinomonadaceae bacterium]
MKHKSYLALLLIITLSPHLLAQQPTTTPDDDIVRITTSLVQFDFIVTDKRGNQITDLKTEDIEVFQDGNPQAISNFTYISTEPEPDGGTEGSAGKSTPPLPVNTKRNNVRRIIALVVDDLGMSFETVVPTRNALRKFVEQQLRPGDLVALLRTGGEVGALQQFTSDKRQLLANIQRLRWNFCSRRGIHSTQPLTQDVQSRRLESPLVPPFSPINSCSQNLDVSIQSLRFIINGMRDLPGRKSMIILSDSLPTA